MTSNSIVLIDTSYIFHRVTACEVWCKKSHNTFDHDTVLNNFSSSISKLSKKLGVEIENMILCRDSDVEKLWRRKLSKSYKMKRSYSDYGPYIKELYKQIQKLFNIVLRVDGAEADDIIAIISFFYLQQNKRNHIYIVSNDKDFYQLPDLFSTNRIHILDNSKFQEKEIGNFSLKQKIIKGDPSDNIKPLRKDYDILDYLHNSQLIDLSYVPRFVQDEIFKTGYFPLNSNTKPLPIQLGFACINTELRKKHIFCGRRCVLKTIENKGIDYLKDLIRKNVDDLESLVRWNYENGIRVMRIGSDLIPHYANPKLDSLLKKSGSSSLSLSFIRGKLQKIGRLARLYKQRLTFHPGQFNILSTPDEKVFQATFRDLSYHCEVLDLMGMDQDSVMVIHGGGLYDNKEAAMVRFIYNFHRLPENVKRRLVIEHCERCYNVEDMLFMSDETGCPVVFDTHHYNCYNQGACKKEWKLMKEARYYIPKVLETWTRRDIKPKFHISEQRPSSRIGTHSDYVEEIPEYLLEIPEKYGIDIDIMVECKSKQSGVFHLYNNYPELSPW